MLKKRQIPVLSILFFFFLCIASQSFALSPTEPREGKEHLWWAEELLSNITPVTTSYRHTNDYSGISWKGYGSPHAVSHTDCSGFIDELFSYTYGFMPDYMLKWLGGKHRPTASSYYAAIIDQRGFIHIEKVKDALPGDILAVSYPCDRSNTGHVMLIAEAPKKIASGKPYVDGTEQWQVAVIDSSMSPHGKNDTRRRIDGSKYGGLGKGVLRVYVDREGEVTGYTWSLSKKSEYHDRKERPVAIGRFDKAYHTAGRVF